MDIHIEIDIDTETALKGKGSGAKWERFPVPPLLGLQVR